MENNGKGIKWQIENRSQSVTNYNLLTWDKLEQLIKDLHEEYFKPVISYKTKVLKIKNGRK